MIRLRIGLFAGLTCGNTDLPSFGMTDFEIEVPAGTTVGTLRNIVGINPAIPLLAMVDNHGEHEDFILSDGSRVAFFPPIGGG